MLLQKLRTGNDPNPGDITSYDNLRAERDQRVTATEVLGGTAVAIALTGLALYFFDQPMSRGHRTHAGGALGRCEFLRPV